MINRVTISNYCSIGEELVLELGKFTALVGRNSSGKSNIVDALMFVSDVFRVGLDAALAKREGLEAIRRRDSGQLQSLMIRVEWNDPARNLSPSFSFHIQGGDPPLPPIMEFRGGGRDYPDFDGYMNLAPRIRLETSDETRPGSSEHPLYYIRDLSIYSILPAELRSPQAVSYARPMHEHGRNWASILRESGDQGWKNDVRTALATMTDDIDDYRVEKTGPHLITEFHHTRGGEPWWSVAAQESDGTLRVAGILAALYQKPTPTLVGIEEPELNIHPGVIPLLYDYFMEASTRSQVIVTTHSPELLSLIDADDVRVVERHNGQTTIGRLDESQRNAAKQRLLTLGEMMQMEPLRQEATSDGVV
jgi:predicted ATPase